jgi:hypothetical protein
VHHHPGDVGRQRDRSARGAGSLHAAEHAAIGLLPLVASCDRGDIGGVSTALGPEDGLPTIFVYDGYPGGAGFADRGYRQLALWWEATAAAIEACECPPGVRRACSPRNAETATIRWTSRVRCGCYARCWPNSPDTVADRAEAGRPTPRRPSRPVRQRNPQLRQNTGRCRKLPCQKGEGNGFSGSDGALR